MDNYSHWEATALTSFDLLVIGGNLWGVAAAVAALARRPNLKVCLTECDPFLQEKLSERVLVAEVFPDSPQDVSQSVRALALFARRFAQAFPAHKHLLQAVSKRTGHPVQDFSSLFISSAPEKVQKNVSGSSDAGLVSKQIDLVLSSGGIEVFLNLRAAYGVLVDRLLTAGCRMVSNAFFASLKREKDGRISCFFLNPVPDQGQVCFRAAKVLMAVEGSEDRDCLMTDKAVAGFVREMGAFRSHRVESIDGCGTRRWVSVAGRDALILLAANHSDLLGALATGRQLSLHMGPLSPKL